MTRVSERRQHPRKLICEDYIKLIHELRIIHIPSHIKKPRLKSSTFVNQLFHLSGLVKSSSKMRKAKKQKTVLKKNLQNRYKQDKNFSLEDFHVLTPEEINLKSEKRLMEIEKLIKYEEELIAHLDKAIEFIEQNGVREIAPSQYQFIPLDHHQHEANWAQIITLMQKPDLIQHAAFYGHIKALHFLLHYCKPEVINENSVHPAIACAIYHQNPDVSKAFLLPQYLPKVKIDTTDNFGRTPLFIAAEFEKYDIVVALVEIGKANVNIRNEDSKSPFMAALEMGDTKTALYLLNSGSKFSNNDERIRAQQKLQEIIQYRQNPPPPLTWQAAAHVAQRSSIPHPQTNPEDGKPESSRMVL